MPHRRHPHPHRMVRMSPGFAGHRHVHPHVNSVHYHPHYLKLHIVFIIIAAVMVVAIGIGIVVWWVVSAKNTSDMNWTERTTGRKENEKELDQGV